MEERVLNDQQQARRDKITQLQQMGIYPFGNAYNRSHLAGQIREELGELSQQEIEEKHVEVKVAGRIMSKRRMGKLGFMHIQDKSGQIQIVVNKAVVGEEAYEIFKINDVGDFVGIEGYVGAGKSAICRELLNHIHNSIILEGGNLYRAIVYTLLQEEKNILKLKFKLRKLDITDLMEKYKVDIKIENNESVIYIDGVKISEEELQSKASSLAVSIVGGLADNTRLFKYAREYIENLKKDYNVIVSGRALMEIYPNQDYHIFITADLEERVKRKCIQYSGKETEKEVRKNIVKRDRLQKLAGFYKIYPNTITVDVTNCNSVEESTEKVYNLICKEGIKNNGIC